MNTCNEPGLNTLRYLDRDLRGAELEDYLAHLQKCTDCETHLEAERALSALLRRSRPLYSAPESLHARVSAMISQRPGENRPPCSIYQRVLKILKRPSIDAKRPNEGTRRGGNLGKVEKKDRPAGILQRSFRSGWWR
jgi:hypothetical protein